MGLAKRIRSARKERRLSQEAAAHATGMSVRAYRSLETGEAVDPHYSTLLGISRGLGVPITDLLEETGQKAGAPSPHKEEEERRTATKEEAAEAQRAMQKYAAEATAYADRWEHEAHERITEGTFPEWRYKEIVWAAVGIGRLLDEAIERAGTSTPLATVARARDASVGMFDAVLRVGDIADAIEEKPVARKHLRVIQGEKPA